MKAVLSVVVLACALAACGGGDELSADARRQLAPLVRQVRERSETFDPDGARAALGELRQTVAALRRRGELGEERAVELLSAAAEVERRLELAPTTTTTTTTTTVPPVVDDDDDDRGGGRDNGEGKGNGRGKDEGAD